MHRAAAPCVPAAAAAAGLPPPAAHPIGRRPCRSRFCGSPPPCCGATRGSGRSSCTARAWRARRRSCTRRSARSGRRSRVRPHCVFLHPDRKWPATQRHACNQRSCCCVCPHHRYCRAGAVLLPIRCCTCRSTPFCLVAAWAAEGKPIPTELRKEEAELRKQVRPQHAAVLQAAAVVLQAAAGVGPGMHSGQGCRPAFGPLRQPALGPVAAACQTLSQAARHG